MPKRSLPLVGFATGLILALGAAGCGGGEEADPDAVNARLRDLLPGLVEPTNQSIEFAGESTALAGLSDSMAAIDESLNLPFSIAPIDISTSEDGAVAVALPEGEQTGEEVADSLAERLFTAENYEGEGVYRIPLDMVCPADAETGQVDPECAETWARAELRIKVEVVDDGLDFTLLVGPDRSAPLTLELRRNRITVAVDLGEAADAIAFLAPETELPEVLEGVVAFSLVVNGPEDISFEIAVRESVRVEANTADGRISFSTEAKEPLASLRIEVAVRRLTALFDLGRTQLSMPNQMNDESSLAAGIWSIDWRGLSFTATAQDGADEIVIDNIGLGDDTSTIKLDDTQLIGVDLNPNDGRRYTMTLRPDPAGGLPIVTFEPGVELLIDVFLQPLADAGDLIDPWLLDDSYRIALTGDAPATQSIAPDDVAGTPGALRIARGTLAIESETASVTVSAGQCLLADEVSDGEHPLLGGLAAGACP
jgi:hypothetical protein